MQLKSKNHLLSILSVVTISLYGCQSPQTNGINKIQLMPASQSGTAMNEEIFWKIMDKICRMGDFIVATGKDGASANIKGKFNVGLDGREKVIENAYHDHVHLYPEQLSRFNFTYIDAGYGEEPCIEIINKKNETALKLFYFGGSKREKYEAIITEFKEYRSLITGEW